MTTIREAMQTIEATMLNWTALEPNRTRRARGLHLLRRAKLRLAILERWGTMDIRIPVSSCREKKGGSCDEEC